MTFLLHRTAFTKEKKSALLHVCWLIILLFMSADISADQFIDLSLLQNSTINQRNQNRRILRAFLLIHLSRSDYLKSCDYRGIICLSTQRMRAQTRCRKRRRPFTQFQFPLLIPEVMVTLQLQYWLSMLACLLVKSQGYVDRIFSVFIPFFYGERMISRPSVILTDSLPSQIGADTERFSAIHKFM